ncbi:MAG: response regulator [Anaerolineae bacterium]
MPEARQATAMVVDDEQDLAWALEQTLVRNGWQVAVAHTGGAAIAYASSSAIHIAFVDAKLPDMDGLVVGEQISRLQPSAAVVLISGYFYPEDGEVQDALEKRHFTHFISKPLDLSEIMALARTRWPA